MSTKQKIIAIVGPTAVGKTALSIALAHHFNGEIISADSRQVYRGLDLGTGKVTKEEMQGIPHHLLDVADPREQYTVHQFTADAKHALHTIIKNDHQPIIVGGSFMYLDTFLGRISLPEVPMNNELRQELSSYAATELYERLKRLDPARSETIDPDNPRRLIRAIEVATALGAVPRTKVTSPYDVLLIGLTLPFEVLEERIKTRLITRLEAGMVAEVERCIAEGVLHERLETLGLEYRYLSRYLRGLMTKDALVTELGTKIRQYAKRQLTWLKRDTDIQWFSPDDTEAIFSTVTAFLRD